MKVKKLSELESYHLEWESFKDGDFFAEDIEDENLYYERLFVLVDQANVIYAMAYLYDEEDDGTLEVDMLTSKADEQQITYIKTFISLIMSEFFHKDRIMIKTRGFIDADITQMGFSDNKQGYLVWEKGE